MVVIPEEALLESISDLLMEKLPAELLAIEEGCRDGVHLEPMRYAGSEGKKPLGIGMPYALITIEEGDYTEKDRIVRNVVYTLKIQLKLADYGLVWRYFRGLQEVLTKQNIRRLKIENTQSDGVCRMSTITVQ